MSRAKPLQYEDATPEQQEVWDTLVASRGNPATLVGPDGGLVGPFNAMVSSPGIGKRVSALGAKVRFQNSVDNRLLELAICTVGAHWRSNFEFWAHGRMAIEAGIDRSIVDSLAAGEIRRSQTKTKPPSTTLQTNWSRPAESTRPVSMRQKPSSASQASLI